MRYLEEEDLTAVIQEDQLNDLIENIPGVKDKAESFALARAESYLSGRWDMVAEFSFTGSARNLDLVQNIVDLTIYYIHKRISPRAIPSIRIESYTDVLEWLKMVNAGKLNLNLPMS